MMLDTIVQIKSVQREIEENSRSVDHVTKAQLVRAQNSLPRIVGDFESDRELNTGEEASVFVKFYFDDARLKSKSPNDPTNFDRELWEQSEGFEVQ